MSIHFRIDQLSPAEASFLRWQYGFEDADDAYARVLWQAIGRAWEADEASGGRTNHIARLGSRSAYPDEVALYLRFRSDEGDALWQDLIRRAGLSDRRKEKVATNLDRRRRA
ncbi:MAG: hypothetical protein IPJ28_10850 [Betaproteobacteria bacterium]|nr:hypothetical protein [Betaproteobacteria bacterium]